MKSDNQHYPVSALKNGKLRPSVHTTYVNLQKTLEEIGASEEIMQLIITSEESSDGVIRSGFYDGRNKVAVTYINSIFDFYNKNEMEEKCLKDSSGENSGVRVSYVRLLKKIIISRKNNVPQSQVVSTPCLSISQGSISLKLTPSLATQIKNNHLPVHSIKKGSFIYYVMFSENSGDLYYIRTKSKSAITHITPDLFFVFTQDETFIKNRIRDGKDNIFHRVESLENGIQVYTKSGYILKISNASLLNANKIGKAPVEAFIFSNWEVNTPLQNGQGISNENKSYFPLSPGKLAYRKLPNDSGVELVGFNLMNILDKIYKEMLQPNRLKILNSAKENWNETDAAQACNILSRELLTILHQFKQQVRQEIPNIIKASVINGSESHPMLSFFYKMDFWYERDSEKLLAANTSEGFRIVGRDPDAIMAVNKNKLSPPYSFPIILNPDRSRRPEPDIDYLASFLPPQFNNCITSPTLYNRAAPLAEYTWNGNRQEWDGRSENVLFSVSRNRIILTGFDYITPIKQSTDESYRKTELSKEFDKLNGANFTEVRDYLSEKIHSMERNTKLPFSRYTKKTLISIEFPFEKDFPHLNRGWFDTVNRRSFPGIKSQSDDELLFFGSSGGTDNDSVYSKGWCYNKTTKNLYHIKKTTVEQVGYFDNIEVANDGGTLIISCTSGNDRIIPYQFHMDNIYANDGETIKSLNTDLRSRNNLAIHLYGNGGVDTFEIKNNDLKYFSEIVVKVSPKGDNNAADTIDQCMQLVKLDSNSFLYKAWREKNDLILKNRFDPEGNIRIMNVWSKQNELLPKSTIIKFKDTSLLLTSLRDQILVGGGSYSLPLIVNNARQLNDYYNIPASASNPLFIELGSDFQATPKRKENAIKITFEPVESNRTNTNEADNNERNGRLEINNYAFAQGSVQIKQFSEEESPTEPFKPVINQNYHILQFDDSRGCHLCLKDIRLSKHKKVYREHEFVGSKRRFSNNKYVATWKGKEGYPLITSTQISTYGIPLDKDNHYPQVVLDDPNKPGQYPVYAVFADIENIKELQFRFNKDDGKLNWVVNYGRVFTRSGQILDTADAALNVLAVRPENKKLYLKPFDRTPYYKVFPFDFDDVKLIEYNNNWRFEANGYSQPVGFINEDKAVFAQITSLIFFNLSDKMSCDGFVFAGKNSYRILSSWDLASALEYIAPRIIDTSTDAEKVSSPRGNSLNNIIYVDAKSDFAQVQGLGGNDVILLGEADVTANKKAGSPTTTPVQGDSMCRYPDLMASALSPVLDGGEGNDIYYVPGATKIIDRQGDHHVLLSSASRADLRELYGAKSTTVYLTDLTNGQVTFTLCDKSARSTIPLTSDKQTTTITEDHLVGIVDINSSETLALISPSSLKSIYFKGGKVTHNPVEWITQQNRMLESSDNTVGALTYVNNMIRSGKYLLSNYLKTVIKREESSSLKSVTGESITPFESGINHEYQTLIQRLASLGGEQQVVNSLPVTPVALGNATLHLASPLVNTTGGFGSK